ncbi:hypothetical protein CC2G_007773 [Coprinopsis cinerea AmutBmut pab1-1]|nr:hypothetical protein CC2G_007773 [Coprinopsis cinerea AmutBmut pab1-1]
MAKNCRCGQRVRAGGLRNHVLRSTNPLCRGNPEENPWSDNSDEEEDLNIPETQSPHLTHSPRPPISHATSHPSHAPTTPTPATPSSQQRNPHSTSNPVSPVTIFDPRGDIFGDYGVLLDEIFCEEAVGNELFSSDEDEGGSDGVRLYGTAESAESKGPWPQRIALCPRWWYMVQPERRGEERERETRLAAEDE